MAVISLTTSDPFLDGCLATIRSARFGKNIRTAIVGAVERCYNVGIIRAGGAKNGITRSRIDEHTERIATAVYGEEVRDALKTVLSLCYLARGIAITDVESSYFNDLISAQIGEDLKNSILRCIIKCYQDVS